MVNTICFSQEYIVKIRNPREVTSELNKSTNISKEIEGLSWNRWTSKNFTVCSINDKQAQYLHKHLELVKTWAFARWGLSDVDFSHECKLICVDDPILYKKMFNLTNTKIEVRRNTNGSINEIVIFMLLNAKPSEIIPEPITEVCLIEFAQKYETKFSMLYLRGMRVLNCTIPQIKDRILEVQSLLKANQPLFFSKSLFDMDLTTYQNLPSEKQKLFDNCSSIFCLMVRKEFGQDIYLKLMKSSCEGNSEKAINEFLGFKSYSELDKTFKRYMLDLTKDIEGSKTPDKYLQITEIPKD